MDKRQYQKLKAIVGEALKKPTEEREAFLEEICVGDEELYREAGALVAAEAELNDFLEHPAVPREPEDGLPKRREIGPYQLLRLLGQGGMGVVFLASRRQEFEQKVALKLIRRGMDSDEILQRFQHERSILSSLEHPNIARLYDGGTAEDGRPYFVMELVTGQPLHRFCETHDLSVEERLGLFRQICEAVQYAHRNAVVHRDIKPGNILVTPARVPKLLDFGIAKLLGERAGESPQTTIIRPFTREYASPEQLTGGVITTASDVYALGVLLYELLAGSRPYANQESTTDSLLEAISGSPPSSPGRLARKLGRRVDRDLEAIMLKCLRPELDHRYGSVEQLLADFDRYEQGLPVLARRGTRLYRAGKFLRRNHRRISMAVVALGLLGSLLASGIQKKELNRQKERLEQSHIQAENLSKYMLQVFKAADPWQSGQQNPALMAMLDEAAGQIDEYFLNDTAFRPAFLSAMGTAFRRNGRFELAERFFRESLAIRRQVLPSGHRLIATSASHLALSLLSQGRYEKAETLLREALEIDRSNNPGDHPHVAGSLNSLAGALKQRGNFEEAVELYAEALAMKKRLHMPMEDDRDRTSVARGYHNFAAALQGVGDLEGARVNFLRAEALFQQLDEPVPTRIANTLSDFGALLRELGELDEAQQMLEESLRLRRLAYSLGPHAQVAESLRELARLARVRGEVEVAGENLRETLEIQTAVLDAKHPEIATTLCDLALLARDQGLREEALEHARRAAQIFAERLSMDHWRLVQARELVASLEKGG